MLDIGWGELLIIGVVALIVVGPKELPGLFKKAGHFMGQARGMAREFQRSMEQAADDTGLNEAVGGLKSINRVNLNSATSSARKYAENLIKDRTADPATPAVPPAAGKAASTPDASTAAKAEAPAGTPGASMAPADVPGTPTAAENAGSPASRP